jgi:hypothetical protein
VTGGGNGQEFRDAFDDGDDDGMERIHLIS